MKRQQAQTLKFQQRFEAGQTVHDPLESYVAFGTFAGFDPMLEQNDEWAVSRRYMSLEISLRSATIPLPGVAA